MNDVIMTVIGFVFFYTINLIAWAIATKSFKASLFCLAFIYTVSASITSYSWRLIKFLLFTLSTQVTLSPVLLKTAGLIIYILDLVVFIFALIIIPLNMLHRFGSHLASPKEINRAVYLQIIIVFVLAAIIIIMKDIVKVEMK